MTNILIKRRIILVIVGILVTALLAIRGYFSFVSTEYSRENFLIKLKDKNDKNEIKLLWEENTAKVFLPSYIEFDEAELYSKNDVYIQIGNKNEYRFFSLDGAQNNMEVEVKVIERKDDQIIDTFLLDIFRTSKVPAMFLNTKSGDMDKVDDDKDYEEMGSVYVIDADGNVNVEDNIKISGRGNTTWDSKKKPYQIDLKKKASILGMKPGARYCLLANSYDSTYMNNMVGLDIARNCGVVDTPEANWVDVYFNGKYNGLYLITESIEINTNSAEHLLSIENNKLNPNNTVEYKVFEEEKKRGVILDTPPKDVTGFYFLDRDFWTERECENRKMPPSWFETDNGFGITIREPKYASKEEVDYISNLINEMELALMSEDTVNPETGKGYSEYIDVESWARWYIVAELSRDMDKDGTNTYFKKYPDSISEKIFMGPMWDFDFVWGTDEDYRDTAEITKLCGGWFENICDDENFNEVVCKVWNEDFYPYINFELYEKMNVWQDYIESSVNMDQNRWGGHFGVQPLENDEGEIVMKGKFVEKYDFSMNCSRLYEWITERAVNLNNYWNARKWKK